MTEHAMATRYAKRHGYSGVQPDGEWNGYSVFQPLMPDGEMLCIGPPEVFLVRDGRCRMSDYGESFAYPEEQIRRHEKHRKESGQYVE